jgi:hypothetical protein
MTLAIYACLLAVGAGFITGSGYGINTLSSFVTRSCAELQKLCVAMGYVTEGPVLGCDPTANISRHRLSRQWPTRNHQWLVRFVGTVIEAAGAGAGHAERLLDSQGLET